MNLIRSLHASVRALICILCLALLTNETMAQADECAAAVPLTIYTAACGGATAGTTAGMTQSQLACVGDADDDVWFSFVPNGGTITITVTGGAGALQLKDPVWEVFSGTCGSLTQVLCRNNTSTNTETGTISNLTNGATYYVRVHSFASGTGQGTFTICLTKPNPPANDNCASATVLTPASTCVTGVGGSQATGNLVNATNSGIAAGTCGGAADDDVWYSFVAQNSYQGITVSGLGSNIAVTGAGMGGSAVLEIFSSSDNTCTGTLTQIACGNVVGTTLLAQANGLTVGNTYFARVYSTNSISLTSNAGFNICVQNPPANDNCSGAISVIPAATCVTGAGGSQVAGTLLHATGSGIPAAGCGGVADDDVWFSFVAQYTTQTVNLTGIGSNIAVSGAGLGGSAVMEVFSSSDNTCGGTLTSIACGRPSGTNLVAYANSLVVGNTYYVRVYSTNNVQLQNNANFNFCVTNPPTGAPITFFGKSFINITKGLNGGTVETGDVLEVRAAITVRPTSMLDSCAFFDAIPAGTSYVPGSLAIHTNEGKVYKSFTDAMGDDAGWINGSNIGINLGYNTYDNPASATRKGRIRSGHIPTVSGSCVMIASYRVTVTAALNSIINLGGGTFTYALITAPTTLVSQNFNANNVIVYTNTGLCSNASGVNVLDNTIAGDFNGTFGSGNTINRVASPNMPAGYTYVEQTGGRPGDFTYTISNNMSNNAAGYSTSNSWPKPESPVVHRIFGVWDVIGDHTGAADPAAGNPAADTTNGQTGGYMLLVNAAYTLDTVFKYPISGLCPNTYYEISFWIRNVCSRCGVDSLGRGASGIAVPAGYIPTDVGDSSGVYPNLSFSIDGVNHYTTGNVRYTGQWIQKGFVFRTGPAQTSIEFAIANNAPGGGGNDWALDDISLSTCTPNLNLVPSGNSQVCYGNPVNLSCSVISYFNNYVYYQWQVSRDNGVTWTDTLSMGTGSPVFSGGNYVYNSTFPAFIADSSQHFVQYRIRVATTPANLYDGCSFYNSTNIVVLVNNCMDILNTNLVSFDAILKNRQGVLNWKTKNNNERVIFDVQKSWNGTNFFTIGTVQSIDGQSSYTFTDPEELSSFAYYRISVQEPSGSRKNSRIKLLSVTEAPYQVLSLVNPFRDKLTFDLNVPRNTPAAVILSDQHGKTLRMYRQQMMKGLNLVEVNNLGALPNGTYVLQVITESGTISKKVVKL
jgi:trimeric autotransporter adhesin